MIIDKKKFSVLISNKSIQKRISYLANKINKDYKNKEILFLCVLNGSFMFASELYKKIKAKSRISFIKIKSYEGTKSNKIINLIGLDINLKNQDVIIVEDIVDTGKTISYIRNKLKCKSLRIATLLSKPTVHNYKLDYVGFEIPNKFVVGYGLDYNGLGRNLMEIYHEA